MNRLRDEGDVDNFANLSFEEIHYNLVSGNSMIVGGEECASIIKLVMNRIYNENLIIIKQINPITRKIIFIISIE